MPVTMADEWAARLRAQEAAAAGRSRVALARRLAVELASAPDLTRREWLRTAMQREHGGAVVAEADTLRLAASGLETAAACAVAGAPWLVRTADLGGGDDGGLAGIRARQSESGAVGRELAALGERLRRCGAGDARIDEIATQFMHAARPLTDEERRSTSDLLTAGRQRAARYEARDRHGGLDRRTTARGHRIRASGEDGVFAGVCTVYEVPDEDSEIIERGAFTESLARSGGRVKLLTGHNREKVDGTAHVTEDGDVVRVRAVLDLGLESARETWRRIKGGLLDSLSVGYRARMSDIMAVGNEVRIRKGDLREVSVVAFGAHPAARITGRG